MPRRVSLLRLFRRLAAHLVLGGLVACAPLASEDRSRAAQHILSGDALEACDWPMVVALDRECSGVLVHPELVLFAGHCGADLREALFGANSDEPVARATLERCAVHPDAKPGGRDDFGFCWLARPMNLPLVPIATGCEVAEVEPAAEVTLVGFGLEGNFGRFGVKRQGRVRITEVGNVISTEGGSVDGCEGDSGGPVFIRTSTGAWRLLAIQSAGLADGCVGSGGLHALAANALSWLELETGLDVSPCSDPLGAWGAGPRCTGFPTNPAHTLPSGGESTGDLCSAEAALEPPSSACGPAFSENAPDARPPRLIIVAPSADSLIESDESGTAHVHVSIDVDDAGSGVRSVSLTLSTPEQNTLRRLRELPPFDFDFEAPIGVWQLTALATDHAGNAATSATSLVVAARPGESDSGCSLRPNRGASAGHPSAAHACLLVAFLRRCRRRAAGRSRIARAR